MPSGWSTVSVMQESLPTSIAAARVVREFSGTMVRLAERHDLGKGKGVNWNEISLARMTAQAVDELSNNENFQLLQDTLLTIEPTMVQVTMLLTRRMKAKISPNVAAEIGVLGQNAMNRKKDLDGLAIVQAATTDLGLAGAVLAFSQIGAAVARGRGNATETTMSAFYTVLHPFGIKDIQDDLISGVGTYAVPQGLTADIFRRGFQGSVSGSEVYDNGNITIDAADDAEGGTFARESLLLIDGMGPRGDTEYFPRLGGGSDVLTLTDEYAFAERGAGIWMYSHTHDATNPA